MAFKSSLLSASPDITGSGSLLGTEDYLVAIVQDGDFMAVLEQGFSQVVANKRCSELKLKMAGISYLHWCPCFQDELLSSRSAMISSNRHSISEKAWHAK